MEVNKLDIDELEYELKIRGFSGVGNYDEMKTVLRGLLKANDNEVENYVVLDPKQEIDICISKIRKLKDYVDEIDGSRSDEGYRIADTKLCHLLGRIDRITTNDEKLKKTRSVLLKTILHLMREMETKVQNSVNTVSLNREQSDIAPVSKTLAISRSKMYVGIANENGKRDDDIGLEIFSHQGVALKKANYEHKSDPIPGTLSILQYKKGKCIEWKPTEVSFESENTDAEWDVVDAVRRRTCSTSSNVENYSQQPVIKIAMTDLKSYKIKYRGRQISLMNSNDTRYSFIFQCGNADSFISALRAILNTRRSGNSKSTFNVLGESEASKLNKSFNELNILNDFGEQSPAYVWNFVRNFHTRPYETTMQTFSKVTDLILYRNQEQRPVDEEVAELLTKSFHVDDNDKTLEADYTIIEEAKKIVLNSRPIVKREERLNIQQWTGSLDADGRIKDPDIIKRLIFKGGIDPPLRYKVWKYLLNYYPWNYSDIECDILHKEKMNEYFVMKRQWQTITPGQEERFSSFRDKKSLIEKDVNRTDRTLPFYAGDDNSNLRILYDILMTYVMYNFDLGYVQGMSDLLSPILCLMGNEVDAFWCFVNFMDRVRINFDLDQAGMKKQLSELYSLLKIISPELAVYLNKHDSANMFFCFRWLLVLFKREFSQLDIMTLWEVLWTNSPCPNFHLLICTAILDVEKNELMKSGNGFTEILKYVNELSLRMDLNKILNEAEGIYLQLKDAGDSIPTNVKQIIGLVATQENDSENSDEESFVNTNCFVASSMKHSDDNDSVIDDIEKVTFTPDTGEIGFEGFERAIASNYY